MWKNSLMVAYVLLFFAPFCGLLILVYALGTWASLPWEDIFWGLWFGLLGLCGAAIATKAAYTALMRR